MAVATVPGRAPVLRTPDQAQIPGRMPVLQAGGMPAADQARAGTLSYGMSVPQPAPFVPPNTPAPSVPSAPTFGGQAPAPTKYGDFTAPDPLNFQADPSYQFRLGEGMKALQRSAAARGTLLTGGTARALENYGQGAASQEYQNAYNRALQSYTTNRDTNAQNFGQQMSQFQGNLGAFNANTEAGLGYGRLNLDANNSAYDRDYQAAQDQQANQQAQNTYNATMANLAQQASDDAYQQQLAAQRQQNAAPPMPAPSTRRPYAPARPRLR